MFWWGVGEVQWTLHRAGIGWNPTIRNVSLLVDTRLFYKKAIILPEPQYS